LSSAPSAIAGPLDHVRGLTTYWASLTGRSSEVLPYEQGRILLDTLGLGIEQVTTHVGRERPGYDEFVAWILSMAGMPDPVTVARYHAQIDGIAPPDVVQSQFAAINAAPPVLNDAEQARWAEDGVVVLQDAITAAEAEAATEALWQLVSGRAGDPDSWYDKSRRQGIMIQHFQHPAQAAIRRSPRIHKAFAQLWGTADLWMTTDRMSFNPPERPGHSFPGPHLHWDASLTRPIPFGTQGVLYLTDTTADQGALQLVPGFHRRIDAWLDSLGDTDPRGVDLSAEAVTIPAKAGDLVIWREDLPHGASPNRSSRPRLAQYLTMYSAEPQPERPWL
jgi:ectoine hydroxylase-related dioxygenase (phytanoyl-CoA dioxygenase family)